MSIGVKLRSLRKKMKKTLKEQSEVFGVSLNSIYRWEHDLVVPRKSALEKMANFYGVSVNWLITESDAEDNQAEQQLFKMFRKLPDVEKHKVLGYVDRIHLEGWERTRKPCRLKQVDQ